MRVSCGPRVLDLTQPVVMGVLNITPDSFSDGGQLWRNTSPALDVCLQRVEAMLLAGAAIIDIGGESTRPGSSTPGLQEECDRVLPVVEAISARFDTIVSVDTSQALIMTEAARLGAGLLNDVRALQREGALAAAAATGLPVCLMHMQGEPGSMQYAPSYEDVVSDVRDALLARVVACEQAGIARGRILLDPGFGFGKTLEHNLQLLASLHEISEVFPLLVGLSRKSMIGVITGRAVDDRLVGSLALAQCALERGAHILRVHDVEATIDMLKIWLAVQKHTSLHKGQS
jgi:dihydropteroate synthase